jgi:capsule polysaccharide export protein KpsC/LpsZ
MPVQNPAARTPDRRTFVIGFRRWRAWNLAPILRAEPGHIVFVSDCHAALAKSPRLTDRVIVWGATNPAGLAALIATSGARLVRVEDGFIRSVGLGSDLIPPHSLVLDDCGIYFDATRPSTLERLLMTAPDDPALDTRAATLRSFIVAQALTKYNVESDHPPAWANGARPVVLVPGQVETDASIALGCGHISTNLALLRAARAARPDAFLVYKPHPDVMARNRRGALAHNAAMRVADHVETTASIVACLSCTDEVHTMTSLCGFDALLRGIRVVTYGAPFYAGWGLTDDRASAHPAFARRVRRITLDQLVAATLLLYPRYWDPEAGRFTTAEAALATLMAERDALVHGSAPDRLISGFWRRQQRKVKVLARAWLGPRRA